MTQYIPKSALVAEIERRIASLEGIGSENYLHDNCPEQYAMLVTLKSLRFSIDSLEVKEMDLKQSYIEYINNTYNEEFAKSILDDNIKSDLDNSDLFGIMSYGFELGIKAAQKGE